MTAKQFANENVKLVEVSFSEIPEYLAWKECEKDFIDYYGRYAAIIKQAQDSIYFGKLRGAAYYIDTKIRIPKTLNVMMLPKKPKIE